MSRKEKIIKYSNEIAVQLGLKLENKEYYYGKGIGRADNYCIIGDWLVIFEMEFSQRHPEMNILKVWPYLEQNSDKKILLIQHLFDRKSVSPNRIQLCKWVSEKIINELTNRFNYHLIINDFNSNSKTELEKKLKKLN